MNRRSQDEGEDSTGDGQESDISTLTSGSLGGILTSEISSRSKIEGQHNDHVLDQIPPTTKTEMMKEEPPLDKCRQLAKEIYQGNIHSTFPSDLHHRLYLIATDGQVSSVPGPFVVGGNIEQYLRHAVAIPNQDFSMTRELTATGDNSVCIKDAPPAVVNLVQNFYNYRRNLQKHVFT